MQNLIQKYSTQIDQIANILADSKSLVIFTGAGISTASGLPDYRGPQGVWTLRDKGIKLKPPSKPWSEFEPNAAHYALVELQKLGIMKHLISQNVENLHIKSGIKPENISELHGNSTIWKCIKCDTRFYMKELEWDVSRFGRGYRNQKPHPEQPKCKNCKGRLINSVVNFNDPMPEREMKVAKEFTDKCDVFLVVGSSLKVNPAASFPKVAVKKNATLIIINIGETGHDNLADIKIDGDCSVILPEIVKRIENKLS